jgi:integrase
MSISRLPSGRYGAQVHDPSAGRNVRVSKVLGPNYVAPSGDVGSSSFRTLRDAKAAREAARSKLAGGPRSGTCVADVRDRWLTDPLFARTKDSTMVHNRERTKAFAKKYGAVPLADVDDAIVSDWLAGGKRNGTIPALRAMFNDARKAKAGRLIPTNPFAELGIDRGPGNRFEQPATEEMVWQLIAMARKLSGPYFAAWLQVAAFTGMRPAELDALQWARVDFERGRIRVAEQFSAASRAVTSPKNGQARDALLTPHARDALLALPRDGDHVFVNLRGGHFTTSSRAYHWKAIKAKAGWEGSLYLATRHFAGWYMVNVLELASEDVAIALGHTDGGDLVRKLYGHRDRDLALERVQAAYQAVGASNVRPLRVVTEESA